MEEKEKVKVDGSTANGYGGSNVQNYNACPMGTKLGDKVTAVLRLDAKKNGSRGGWGGDNVIRYEGSVEGWKELAMEAGHISMKAAASSEDVDARDSWIWKLVGGVVAAAVLIVAIVLAINLCSNDKPSTVPGTPINKAESSTPAQPPAPAVNILPVQVVNGQNGMPGAPGLQGPKGEDGIDGDDGKNGRNGKAGAGGAAGAPGQKGEPGAAGAPGVAGLQGSPGKDAGPMVFKIIAEEGVQAEADVE